METVRVGDRLPVQVQLPRPQNDVFATLLDLRRNMLRVFVKRATRTERKSDMYDYNALRESGTDREQSFRIPELRERESWRGPTLVVASG